MPTSPATEITKALRQAVKEESISHLKKLLLDPQLLYVTYISAFSSPLERAIKKGNVTMVQMIVEAIKRRYHQDYSPDAAVVINKAIQLEMTASHLDILKLLYSARSDVPVHQKCDLTALRMAALGGHQEAMAVILEANQDPTLSADKLLERALELNTQGSPLPCKQRLLLSPTARPAGIEQLTASAGVLPNSSVLLPADTTGLTVLLPTPATAITPATLVKAKQLIASSKPPQLQERGAIPDQKKLAKMMQMMQTMMNLPDISGNLTPGSSSGEESPTPSLTQSPL